jgi:hypothetical protein
MRYFLWAQVSYASSSSMPFPQHDPLTHKHLFCSLTFGHVGKYSRATCALAPVSSTPTSSNTTSALAPLHPKSNGHFFFFLENYKLE